MWLLRLLLQTADRSCANSAMVPQLLICGVLLGSVLSADILAVFPHTGKSHFDAFQPLMSALVTRGHNLTVISFFPQERPVVNYTDISLGGVAPVFVNLLKFSHLEGIDPFKDFMVITEMGVRNCKPILTSSRVQDLLSSSKTFDLLFIEMFNTNCFLMFVERYKVPYIGMSSSSLFPTMFSRLGSFDNPSYFPNLFFPFVSKMSLLERVINTGGTIGMRAVRTFLHSAREHAGAGLALGRQILLEGIANNITLALVSSHFTVKGSTPLTPAVVEVGGLHIQAPKQLSQASAYLRHSFHFCTEFTQSNSTLRYQKHLPNKTRNYIQLL